MEGSWRGLNYLVQQSETSTSLKIKVMNVTKRELLNDLRTLPSSTRATCSKRCTRRSSAPSAAPLSAPWSAITSSAAVRKISKCWRRCRTSRPRRHAPFVTAAGPELFNWKEFTELGGPRDLAKIFDNDLYARWKSFRESDDSMYVGLAMPHILMRPPYGEDTTTGREL